MFYKYVSSMSAESLFQYFVVIVICITVIVHISPSMVAVLGGIVGIIFVYFLNDRKVAQVQSFNEDLQWRLQSLYPRPQNFELDPDLINLFYNIRDMRSYNSLAYDKALKNVDSLLRVLKDVQIGVQHCEQNYELAHDKYKNAMNHMHSVIYNIPLSDVTLNKYNAALKQLQLILKRHLDTIYKICKAQRREQGNTSDMHFVDELHLAGPKPDDTHALPDHSNFQWY